MAMINLEREAIPRKTLVIFFMIDTSASMAGTRIGAVNSTMEQTIEKLREMNADSADVEIKIAVLEFSSGARWLTPNAPISAENFYWCDLDAGGERDMGEAFRMLEEKLHRRSGFIQRPAGIYAPVIMELTDGEPTDDYKTHLMKLKDNLWFKGSTKVAFAIGDEANENILMEFTGSKEAVVRVPDGRNADDELAKMVQFITVTSFDYDYPASYYNQKELEEALRSEIIDNLSVGFSCSHDKQLFQALQRIQNELGEIILTDAHKFKSVIVDLLPSWECKTIRKRAIEAVESGVYARLEKAAKNGDLEKERLRCVKLLEEDGIAEKLAFEIIGAFAMLFAVAEDDDW